MGPHIDYLGGVSRQRHRASFVGLAIIVLLAIALSPPRADAHARLASSTPEASARLATSPREVILQFDERITMSATGIRVFDALSKRVDESDLRVIGSRATIRLKTPLQGAFVVVWRAVSTDGHPIAGSFTFQVGTGDQASLAQVGERAVLASTAPRSVRDTHRIVRGFLFAFVMLCIGASMWCLVGLPRVWSRPFTALGLFSFLAAAALLCVDGAYVEGLTLSEAFRPSTAVDSLSRVTGRSIAALGVLGLLFGFSLRRIPARLLGSRGDLLNGTTRVELAGFAVVSSVLLATTGHATAGRFVPIAVVSTALHIIAVSTWLSGLVFLLASFSSSDARRAPLERSAALRWSSLATKAVVVMLITGAFAGWRQVGSRDALRDTAFGRLLIFKLSVVAAMVAIGATHRRALLRTSSNEVRWARSTLAAETLAGIVALAVTSILSATIPARAELARPVSLRVTTTSTRTDITVSPARVGPNLIHVYVFGDNGLPRDVADVQFSLSHGETGTLLEVDPAPVGRGHEEALGVDLPLPGTWTLLVRIYVTDFEVETATRTFTIR